MGARVRALLLPILLLLVGVPAWTGDPRLPLLAGDVRVRARGYVPAGGWPARIGALVPVGGMTLAADDAAFGGFSALAVRDGAATLLDDGGNYVRLAIRGRRMETLASGYLPDGPRTGWDKADRDSEALVLDAATGRAWVGFEGANAIWRYAPGFARAEAWRAPAKMKGWWPNSGVEALARLRDGRFVALRESRRPKDRHRQALLFSGDPTQARTRVWRFRYLAPDGYAPSDAAVLPGGDLLVLNRRFAWRGWFSAKLVRIPAAQLRPDAWVRGRVIATLAAPVLSENAEGLAVTREGDATMLWIVTDNDGWFWRPTYLLKFRLAERP
jgi:hypothetical protein